MGINQLIWKKAELNKLQKRVDQMGNITLIEAVKLHHAIDVLKKELMFLKKN